MNAVQKTTPDATPATSVADSRNLHQRLLDVMKEVTYVQKDRPIGNYKVVTHDAVTAKVRPALVKHGVIYYPQNLEASQNGNRTEMRLDIKFVNAANPDDFILVPCLGYGIDAQDKGPGKAVSYAVKMALLKALGLETGEDADDNTNVDHTPEPPPAKNAPGVSKARTEVAEHVRALHGCGTAALFMEALEAERDLWVRVKALYPVLWEGPDGSGLRGEALKQATAYECRPLFANFLKEVIAEAADYQQPKQAAE